MKQGMPETAGLAAARDCGPVDLDDMQLVFEHDHRGVGFTFTAADNRRNELTAIPHCIK